MVLFDDVILSEVRAATSTNNIVSVSNPSARTNHNIYQSSWTSCTSFVIPNIDHEEYWLSCMIVPTVEKSDDNDYILGRIMATKNGETTRYFPCSDPNLSMYYSPAVVFGRLHHLEHSAQMYFVIPGNLKGWTLTLQLIIQYQVYRTINVQTYMTGYGTSQHYHP
jgi:hypothetical protein